jgi:hypothetical protein
MHPLALLQLLILVTAANATPVVAKRIFGDRLAYPVDGNLTLPDGRPLFGPSSRPPPHRSSGSIQRLVSWSAQPPWRAT